MSKHKIGINEERILKKEKKIADKKNSWIIWKLTKKKRKNLNLFSLIFKSKLKEKKKKREKEKGRGGGRNKKKKKKMPRSVYSLLNA